MQAATDGGRQEKCLGCLTLKSAQKPKIYTLAIKKISRRPFRFLSSIETAEKHQSVFSSFEKGDFDKSKMAAILRHSARATCKLDALLVTDTATPHKEVHYVPQDFFDSDRDYCSSSFSGRDFSFSCRSQWRAESKRY